MVVGLVPFLFEMLLLLVGIAAIVGGFFIARMLKGCGKPKKSKVAHYRLFQIVDFRLQIVQLLGFGNLKSRI